MFQTLVNFFIFLYQWAPSPLNWIFAALFALAWMLAFKKVIAFILDMIPFIQGYRDIQTYRSIQGYYVDKVLRRILTDTFAGEAVVGGYGVEIEVIRLDSTER